MKFVKYALIAFITAKLSEKYWLAMFGYTAMATDMILSPDEPGQLLEIMGSSKVAGLAKKLAQDDVDKFFGKRAK